MTAAAAAEARPPAQSKTPHRTDPLRVLRAGGAELGGSLGLKLLTVLQTVVVARLYGAEQIGSVGTALLVIGAIASVTGLGLDRYLLADIRRGARDQLDAAFSLSLIAGAGGVALLLAAAPIIGLIFDDAGLATSVLLLSPLLLNSALSLPATVWERDLKFGRSKVPMMVGAASNITVAAALAWIAGPNVGGLIASNLAALVASMTCLWVMAPSRPHLRLPRQEVRAQLAFGLPLLASGVTTFVAGQGDDALVRWFGDARQLGLYLVAFYLPSWLLAVAEMIARVAVPVMAPLRNDQRELAIMFASLSRGISTLSVGFGGALALFAPEIVTRLYGAGWAEIVPLVQIFSVAFVLRASTGFHWQTLALISGRTTYLMWCSVASAAFMIALAPPLIRSYGLIGGAVYSFLQLGVMGPLVRFPLIMQILGDLSFLRASLPSLSAGFLIVTSFVAARHSLGGPVSAPLELVAFALTYVCLVVALDAELRCWLRGGVAVWRRHRMSLVRR